MNMEKEKKKNLYVKDHQSIVSQEITQSLPKLVREETDGGMKMMRCRQERGSMLRYRGRWRRIWWKELVHLEFISNVRTNIFL